MQFLNPRLAVNGRENIVVAVLLEFQGKTFIARANDCPAGQHMHIVRLDVVQQPLVMVLKHSTGIISLLFPQIAERELF